MTTTLSDEQLSFIHTLWRLGLDAEQLGERLEALGHAAGVGKYRQLVTEMASCDEARKREPLGSLKILCCLAIMNDQDFLAAMADFRYGDREKYQAEWPPTGPMTVSLPQNEPRLFVELLPTDPPVEGDRLQMFACGTGYATYVCSDQLPLSGRATVELF